MKTMLHWASERGQTKESWLLSFHNFSFADYYDHDRMHFGALRILNDDVIAPGKGFGSHPHRNMEIITVILEGSLRHQDNQGNIQVMNPGDIQVMSAGSGIIHSEYNNSEVNPLNLLQIWILPKKTNTAPRYQRQTFLPAKQAEKWQCVVSAEASDEQLHILQDAAIYLGNFSKSTICRLPSVNAQQGIFLFVISGSVRVEQHKLNHRDAIEMTDFQELAVAIDEDTYLLAIQVPV